MEYLSVIFDAVVNYFFNPENLDKLGYLKFNMDMSAIEQTGVGGTYFDGKAIKAQNKRK